MNLLKNYNLIEQNSKLIILLSILGLLPFILGLIDIWINRSNLFFFINLPKYYGSIILTFLGAIYWGIILKESQKKSLSNKIITFITFWSIIPSIWGIMILIFKHNFSIIILAVCFICVQCVDEFLIKYFKFPNWYLLLRRILTLIVVSILIFSYFLLKNS